MVDDTNLTDMTSFDVLDAGFQSRQAEIKSIMDAKPTTTEEYAAAMTQLHIKQRSEPNIPGQKLSSLLWETLKALAISVVGYTHKSPKVFGKDTDLVARHTRRKASTW